MRPWLSDQGRTAWAFLYWNVRKSLFVLRRRRGGCPCHDPSDSGQVGKTGCEAVVGWHQPARFRRVCPLLTQDDRGRWVCGVPASEVRPFWGRALVRFGGLSVGLALVLGGVVFGLMRGIGYEVSPRQIFWPPAWNELPAVRAKLFLQRAQVFFAEGRMREVMHALSSAQAVNPGDFETGLLLARLNEAGNPAFADVLYGQLLRDHPAHRAEIARSWFRSLLARNQLESVARVAAQQLPGCPPVEMAVWTHALIFSAQVGAQPAWVDETAANERVAEPVRRTLTLAAQLLREPDATVRHARLRQTPLVENFSYERIFRIERLLAEGWFNDAGQLLAASRPELTDRDFARLLLAWSAASGNGSRVEREFAALLAPERRLTAAELNLLALHLVNYPDAARLTAAVAAMARIRRDNVEARVETYITLFCAAGVQRDEAAMQAVRRALEQTLGEKARTLDNLEKFFLRSPRSRLLLENVLLEVRPLSLELTYALGQRYFSPKSHP